MSFTAEEYRTAAKVIRSDYPHLTGSALVAEQLEEKAEKLQARREYADDLGMVGVADLPRYRGAKLLGKLLEDGWTPPEGLF